MSQNVTTGLWISIFERMTTSLFAYPPRPKDLSMFELLIFDISIFFIYLIKDE